MDNENQVEPLFTAEEQEVIDALLAERQRIVEMLADIYLWKKLEQLWGKEVVARAWVRRRCSREEWEEMFGIRNRYTICPNK